MKTPISSLVLMALLTAVLLHPPESRAAENRPVEKRIALVIGNQDYASARKLANPVNDARCMAAALAELNFEVVSRTDADLKAMRSALREFTDKLSSGGVALVYFAGHGVQIKGENYLIPVDAKMEREFEVPEETLSLEAVLRALDSAGSNLNIVILDSCRNDPFSRGWRGARGAGEAGLAMVKDAPKGTIVAYSTSPGKTAADGDGVNSPYTASLLACLKQPGIAIEGVFKKVGGDVAKATKGSQEPWYNSKFYDDFAFLPAGPQAPPSPRIGTGPAPATSAALLKAAAEIRAQSRKVLSQVTAGQLAIALKAYEVEYGRPVKLGAQSRTIAVLLGEDPDGLNPRKIQFLELGSEMKNRAGECIDSWGTPYRIDPPDSNGEPRVYSFGPDRIDNQGREDSDDLPNWRMATRTEHPLIVQMQAEKDPDALKVRQLLIFLGMFAADHGGEFPRLDSPSLAKSLSEAGRQWRGDSLHLLVTEGVVKGEAEAVLTWRDPRTGDSLPWLYFPHPAATAGGGDLLLAAPRPQDGKRLVGRTDGTAAWIAEEVFTRRLSDPVDSPGR